MVATRPPDRGRGAPEGISISVATFHCRLGASRRARRSQRRCTAAHAWCRAGGGWTRCPSGSEARGSMGSALGSPSGGSVMVVGSKPRPSGTPMRCRALPVTSIQCGSCQTRAMCSRWPLRGVDAGCSGLSMLSHWGHRHAQVATRPMARGTAPGLTVTSQYSGHGNPA